MGRSAHQQHVELLESWKLTEKDIEYVTFLTSFHSVGKTIYKRKDTRQYYIVIYEESWSNVRDDYFNWRYLTDEELKKYNIEK